MCPSSGVSDGDRAVDAGLASRDRAPRLPPRWIIRIIWAGHRAIHRFTGGRRGLQTPRAGRCGTLRLMTIGRHSAKERSAMLGYLEDVSNLWARFRAQREWGNDLDAFALHRSGETAVVVFEPR
jgi:hypothetical protein